MLVMRGAGGKTLSLVVYRLSELMKGRRREGMKATEIQNTHCAPSTTLSILIRRFGLEEIKSRRPSSVPLHIRLDPIILQKTSPTAERHQVVGRMSISLWEVTKNRRRDCMQKYIMERILQNTLKRKCGIFNETQRGTIRNINKRLN